MNYEDRVQHQVTGLRGVAKTPIQWRSEAKVHSTSRLIHSDAAKDDGQHKRGRRSPHNQQTKRAYVGQDRLSACKAQSTAEPQWQKAKHYKYRNEKVRSHSDGKGTPYVKDGSGLER